MPALVQRISPWLKPIERGLKFGMTASIVDELDAFAEAIRCLQRPAGVQLIEDASGTVLRVVVVRDRFPAAGEADPLRPAFDAYDRLARRLHGQIGTQFDDPCELWFDPGRRLEAYLVEVDADESLIAFTKIPPSTPQARQ